MQLENFPFAAAGLVLWVAVSGCARATRVEPFAPVAAVASQARIIIWDDTCEGSACAKTRGLFFRPHEEERGDIPENRFARVRVIDENLNPKADLLPGQHALVELAPGKHRLFAYAWGNVARPRCVGALEVSVEPNRVYVARLSRGAWHGYELPSGAEVGCLDLTLSGVNGVARYTELVPRLRGSERSVFLSQRLSLPWVDGYRVRSSARAAGLERTLGQLDDSDGLDNLP